MLILILLLIISIFLAQRSNFNLPFLLSLILGAGLIYSDLYKKLLEISNSLLLNISEKSKNFVEKLVLSVLYIISLFLVEKTVGFPEWLSYSGIEIVGFFLILYFPIVLLFKKTFKISLSFALFFLLLAPVYFINKNEVGADYLTILAFLFLFFTFFQSMAQLDG